MSVCDILSYAVMIGCEFAALSMMTRGGRGGPWRVFALVPLLGVNALLEFWYWTAHIPLDVWLAVSFCSVGTVFALLVFVLSRDAWGRRVFVFLNYTAYSAWYVPVFHLVAYRNVFGLSEVGACFAGLVLALAANLAFLVWIVRWVPRGGHGFSWWSSNLAAGVVVASLYVGGIWPVSLVTAPARFCAPFVLASAVAWVVFPLLIRSIFAHRRNAAVEHSLALMTVEVKVRRAAIDFARRLRHDERHHRAQIAEYMLLGQYDRVFDYLRELDAQAEETSLGRLIWCENETVNAILSGCDRQASARGIPFKARAQVERGEGLPDVELVAVLANLVENALNGCCGKGGVEVDLNQRPFGIGIRVTNPVAPDFALSPEGLPCRHPGIGMESVRRVVERYDGQWTYELKDGVLTCRVVLVYGG